MAGFMVAILLIPQGLAYAFLAGVPPQYGLYAGMVPVLIYALWSTSPHIAVGPVAVTSILVFTALSTLAEPFSDTYIQLVILSGLVIGLIQLTLGVARLGILVNLLSYPVMTGFVSAAAMLIMLSQAKPFLGINMPRLQFTHERIAYLATHLDNIHLTTLYVGLGALLLHVLVDRFVKRIPASLIVIIVSIFVSWAVGLSDHGVRIVGEVTAAIPAFSVPDFSLEQLLQIAPLVLAVSVIGLVESIGIARTTALRYDYRVDANMEFVAHGFSKIAGAFFQAIPSSSSYGRSAILDKFQANSTLAGAFSAIFLVVFVAFFMPLIRFIPHTVLAVIIFFAVQNMVSLATTRELWYYHKRDAIMMAMTFLITFFVGMELGVLVGILLSFVMILLKSARPRLSELGKVPNKAHFRNVNLYESLETYDGVLILRIDDQIFFANCNDLVNRIMDKAEAAGNLHHVVLDIRGAHDIDSSGLLALEQLAKQLKHKDIILFVAGAIGPLREKFIKSGFKSKLGHDAFFNYLEEAVIAAQR